MHNNNITIPVKVRVGGIFTLRVYREGRLRQTVGPFDNLVLNQGLDILCGGTIPGDASTNYVMTYVDVGTGTNTPTITDTVLQSPLGNVQIYSSVGSTTYVAGPPAYHTLTSVYTYPLGALVGNISEIGVGGSSTGYNAPIPRPFHLFSRALIVDGGGSPTVISLTSADQLVVTYEVRRYLDLTTKAGSVTISSVNYSTQTQIYSVTSNFQGPSTQPPFAVSYFVAYTTQTLVSPTDSSIPGTGGSSSNMVFDSYTNGSFYRTCYATLSPSAFTSNIGSISLKLWCFWQIVMTPVIPKTADNALTLHFSFSFTQYP